MEKGDGSNGNEWFEKEINSCALLLKDYIIIGLFFVDFCITSRCPGFGQFVAVLVENGPMVKNLKSYILLEKKCHRMSAI